MTRTSRKRKPPGLSPGVPVLTGEALPPRIHAIRYSADTLEESDPRTAEECFGLLSRGGVLWIDVQGLADLDLLKSMGERFSLHPLAIEDVVSFGQRPKVDDYDSHLFIILRMPESGETIQTDQTSLFVGPGYVLAFQEHYGDCLDPVRERLRKGKGLLRRSGSDYLAYAILDAVIDGHFPILESLGERLEALDDRVVQTPRGSTLEQLHSVKRGLLTLRRSVWPLRDALSSLAREEHDLVTAGTRLYLRDCVDHSIQILDMVDTYRELAADLVNIHISNLSQRLNEVIKVLTIITTIFIPLTFVVGVYGMNFEQMPELRWRYGYPIVMAAMAVMVLMMVWYFLRRGWIGADDLSATGLSGRRKGRRKERS